MKWIAAEVSATSTITSRAASLGGIGRLSRIGVATSPGITTLARIPVFRRSALMNVVKLMTAAFAAPYAKPLKGPGVTPASDETLIIVPLFAANIVGTAACVQNIVPIRLESMTPRISSGDVSTSLR